MPQPSPAPSYDKKLVCMALLVGMGIALHRLEALLPLPSPWIKLGLANIMTLSALVFLGAREAMTVTVLRIILGSVLGGTFLGPTFFFSLAGGLAATACMALLYIKGPGIFSMIGISVAGAYAHVTAIVLCLYLFFIPQKIFIQLLPAFLLFGLVSGTLTGFAANALIRKLEQNNISFR